MPQTIEVFITPKGEIRLETKGYSGSSCQDASRALEQALLWLGWMSTANCYGVPIRALIASS